VSGLTVGSVLALVALGYNLVFSSTRIVNFAQGSMLVVAGFAAYQFTSSGLPIWAAFLLSIAVSAAVGVAVELVAVRPLSRFDPSTNVGWLLTTFSVGLVLIDLVRMTVDARPQALPPLAGSVFGWRGSQVSGVAVTPTDLLIVVTTIGLMVGVELFQRRTMLGRSFRAVAQDRQAAALLGINTSKVVMLTFAFAGALAAVGAVLLAPKLFVKLDNGIFLGLQAFIAAVLGGLGSTRGAVVGGYAIGFTSAFIKTLSPTSGQYETLVIFVLFLAVLVVRPSGIFGAPAGERA
jgi:branched-chain amino acid transport system permease protein